jgi:hypothetical protein
MTDTVKKKKNKGGRKGYTHKFNKSKILKAIENSGGIISTIAERLKCNWHTAQKYANLYPETRQMISDEEETLLDNAESVLHSAIANGDLQGVKYLLSTKGKKRGYVEKAEFDIKSTSDVFLDIMMRVEDENDN